MIPRQLLGEGPAAEVERGVEAVRREGVSPDVHAAVVRPAVEASAPALGRLEHVGQPAVATREDALQEGELCVVPAELDLVPAELPAEEALPDTGLLHGQLPGPLKGRVGLRDEGRNAGRHAEPAAGRLAHATRQLRDAAHVGFGLAREADHEIELEAPPAEIGE